jgi:hypothetical protein
MGDRGDIRGSVIVRDRPWGPSPAIGLLAAAVVSAALPEVFRGLRPDDDWWSSVSVVLLLAAIVEGLTWPVAFVGRGGVLRALARVAAGAFAILMLLGPLATAFVLAQGPTIDRWGDPDPGRNWLVAAALGLAGLAAARSLPRGERRLRWAHRAWMVSFVVAVIAITAFDIGDLYWDADSWAIALDGVLRLDFDTQPSNAGMLLGAAVGLLWWPVVGTTRAAGGAGDRVRDTTGRSWELIGGDPARGRGADARGVLTREVTQTLAILASGLLVMSAHLFTESRFSLPYSPIIREIAVAALIIWFAVGFHGLCRTTAAYGSMSDSGGSSFVLPATGWCSLVLASLFALEIIVDAFGGPLHTWGLPFRAVGGSSASDLALIALFMVVGLGLIESRVAVVRIDRTRRWMLRILPVAIVSVLLAGEYFFWIPGQLPRATPWWGGVLVWIVGARWIRRSAVLSRRRRADAEGCVAPVVCPGCGAAGHAEAGALRCTRCGVRFELRVEPAVCRCGHVLDAVNRTRCPECGVDVEPIRGESNPSGGGAEDRSPPAPPSPRASI